MFTTEAQLVTTFWNVYSAQTEKKESARFSRKATLGQMKQFDIWRKFMRINLKLVTASTLK